MARVLLIDDDDLLRGVLAKTLGYAGHTVVEAVDGQQGVELFRATPIDVVITDLIMPVQEGVETIIALRRDNPTLPIIAISGGLTGSRVYLDIAGKVGANRILHKPFAPPELMRAIEEVLAESRQPPA